MIKNIKKIIIKFLNYRISNNAGFTILEITVCIFIIVIGLVGILSLSNQNVQVSEIGKNTLVASQLAQEGLEVVRNKRDINWLQKGNWETSLSPGAGHNLDLLQGNAAGTGGGGVNYTVDASTGAIQVVPSIGDSRTQLYLNATGFYTHVITATSTAFSRMINIGNESTASTSVTCTVQWKKGTNTYNYYAQTVLYNWK